MQVNDIKLLVTFGLITYNQERFVEEAVLSAFAQDYESLEIVISDDCSSDNTFAIIQKLVDGYTGPHKIIVNRNQNNLGLAGNINRMWGLSSGEFLVIQAGDDISLPHRTSRLVDAWQSKNPRPSIVCSNETFIDENGGRIKDNKSIRNSDSGEAIMETLIGTNPYVVGGCSAGYAKELHFEVGPLLLDVRAEDFVYSFRALLAKGVLELDEALVLYRQNPQSIMGKHKAGFETRKIYLNGELARLKEHKKAIDYYGGVSVCQRWRLNRKIEYFKRIVLAKEGSYKAKIFFSLWLVFTGRWSFILDRFKH